MTDPDMRDLEDAIEILAICASQPEWDLGCRTVPGDYSYIVRNIAEQAIKEPSARAAFYDGWRECYAEAEALLRDRLHQARYECAERKALLWASLSDPDAVAAAEWWMSEANRMRARL